MQPAVDDFPSNERLLFIQFGDYYEAAQRLSIGGPEMYSHERYSVGVVEDLAAHLDRVTVLSLSADYPLKTLPSGVRCLGVELYPKNQPSRIAEVVWTAARQRATRVVVHTPCLPVLQWARLTGKPTLPVFAHCFGRGGPQQKLRAKLLAWELNGKNIEWVANHNLAASLDLARIGVDPFKILPWDWPAEQNRTHYPTKVLRSHEPFRLLFVGPLKERKGVGDAIRAISHLRATSANVELSVVGEGEKGDELRRLTAQLGLTSAVRFLGPQPHDRIIPLMNEYDAVVVPSRHDDTEGLPSVIFEGLSSRSPVIVSDHPIFSLRMTDGDNCVVFKAGSAFSLRDAVRRLIDEPGLYQSLSAAAEASLSSYLVPLKLGMLLRAWLSESQEKRRSLQRWSLQYGSYPKLAIEHRRAA